MKSYSYLIVLCLLGFLFSPSVHAQTGIKVGGNMSRLGWSPGTRPTGQVGELGSFKFGFQAGLWHLFPLGKKTAIGVEAAYTTRGDKYNSYDATLSNISVPVYFQYKFLEKLSGQLGVSGNYTLEKILRGYLKPKNPHVGILIGASYQVSPKIALNARFDYGITQPIYIYNGSVFANYKPGDSYEDFKLNERLRTIEFSLYYTLSSK